MEMEPRKPNKYIKETPLEQIQRDLTNELRQVIEERFVNQPSTERTFAIIRDQITNFLNSAGAYNIVEFFDIDITTRNGVCHINLGVPEHKVEAIQRVLFTPEEQQMMTFLGFDLQHEINKYNLRKNCKHNMELEEWNYPEYALHRCRICGQTVKYIGLSAESYEEGYKDGENDR